MGDHERVNQMESFSIDENVSDDYDDRYDGDDDDVDSEGINYSRALPTSYGKFRRRQNIFFTLTLTVFALSTSVYFVSKNRSSPVVVSSEMGTEDNSPNTEEENQDKKSEEEKVKQDNKAKIKEKQKKKNHDVRDWMDKHHEGVDGWSDGFDVWKNLPDGSNGWDARPTNHLPGTKPFHDYGRPGSLPKLPKHDHQDLDDNAIDPNLGYRVLKEIEHDHTSFTQGLTYGNGEIFESTGRYSQSKIRRLDMNNGTVIQSRSIEPQYFGEGLAFYGKDKLIHITWHEQQGFIYDTSTLKEMSNFSFTTTTNEGWGITHDYDNERFIVSDGSEYLHFWDDKTLQEVGKIKVMRDGEPADEINELEYTPQGVLANIWHDDTILLIDPGTGNVLKEYDFSKMYLKKDRLRDRANVLNGISVTDKKDEFLITGKLWPKMFLVKLDI